jgi:hypothetical protein
MDSGIQQCLGIQTGGSGKIAAQILEWLCTRVMGNDAPKPIRANNNNSTRISTRQSSDRDKNLSDLRTFFAFIAQYLDANLDRIGRHCHC